MIISTSNVIAIRCPECGTLKFHLLSLFAFGRKEKQLKVDCNCGARLAVIGTKDYRTFWFQINCLMCEAIHLAYFSRRRIFAKKIEIISCEDTGVEISLVGPKEEIKRYLHQQDNSLREMADEMGFGEFFESPEVMCQVLDYLYDIAEAEKLYCQCGNYQIDIDVFPDKLELRCGDCDCYVHIYAESDQDLQLIKEAQELILTPDGVELKRQGKMRRRRIKHKK